MNRRSLLLGALPLLLLGACGKPASNSSGDTPAPTGGSGNGAAPAGKKLKIGYVLHVLNDFSQVIKQGAEDAGKDLGVEVEVTGPSTANATEAIGMFQSMAQKKVDGLVAIPMPGDVWVRPLKEVADAGIPFVTANITSEGGASSAWFGQDEYQSGVILATELRKMLEADGKKTGKIVCGNCFPGASVLVDRYRGVKKGFEGSGFTLTDAFDVHTDNTENYGTWENLASANPDMIAAIGLCSIDVPNLYKLKTRTNGKWLIAGYDLNKDTLEAVKTGACQLTLGQHPYLQGYLPVLALVQQLRDKKPIPKGWINVGTELVTKANVESMIPRETDRAAETKWYADYIKKNFGDLAAIARPLPAHP